MHRRYLRAVLLGAGAGLAASWVMEQAKAIFQKLRKSEGDDQGGGEPSTEKLADRLSSAVAGHPVPDAEKARAGALVHYTTGASLGALYGIASERSRTVTAGFGLLYGLAAELVLDMGVVSALKLAPPPSETPGSTRVDATAAHAVFGLTLESVRRTLDTLLP